MRVRQKAHEGCSAKSLWMHFAEERCGSRKVDLFYSVPSVMLQLKPFSKDPTDLLPHEMLKFILIRFEKLNSAAVLPGHKSQVFQVKITLNPINVVGEQIKGAFTLTFPPGRGEAVLPKPLFEERGPQGSMPSTQRFIDHCSFRIVKVRPMKKESLGIMSRKMPVRTSFVNMVTEGRQLFAGGSDYHGSICKGRRDDSSGVSPLKILLS